MPLQPASPVKARDAGVFYACKYRKSGKYLLQKEN